MSSTTTGSLQLGDATIAFRRIGSGPPLVLLHATLSSSRQLRPLASRLATRFDVISVDRRGSGASVSARQRATGGSLEPIDVAVHIADLEALLAAHGVGPAIVVGHSYGGCIALELAARRPGLVSSVWAYEPPYASVGPPAAQRSMAEVAAATAQAARRGGPPAAAEAFMKGVSGEEALRSLSSSARDRVRQAGPSAIADAALLGMEPNGLSRISCPVTVAVGSETLAVYGAIADGLCDRIENAERVSIDAADHMAPIVSHEAIAVAVESSASR